MLPRRQETRSPSIRRRTPSKKLKKKLLKRPRRRLPVLSPRNDSRTLFKISNHK